MELTIARFFELSELVQKYLIEDYPEVKFTPTTGIVVKPYIVDAEE